MAEKKIEHSLRTIVLQYDDTKTETDFEKEMLRAYLALHDHAARFNANNAKLNYEYKELEDRIADTEKLFSSIDRQILAFYNNVQQLKSDNDFEALLKEMEEFFPAIDSIQQEVLQPLYDEYLRLFNEHTAHEAEEEKLGEELELLDEQTTTLYKNYNDYALDLVAWDEDIDDFKNVFSKASALSKFTFALEDRYRKLMATIQNAWDSWSKTQNLINKHFDTGNLLDSSVSDSYASGTGNPALKPIYLIEPGDKLINEFRIGYGLLASPTKHTFTITIPKDVINTGDVLMLQQIIMQMQHFPKLIEKWTFAIRLEIIDFDTRPLDEEEWKGVPAVMRWFRRLSTLPWVIFFLEDRDARGYAIMGDLLADNKLPVVGDKKQGADKIEISGEMLEEICNRLLTACSAFKLYCHNTGYDPRAPIEALLAEFDLPVTYELVQQEYEELIRKGVKLVAVKSDK
ncbi:MAG: hypothetical protein POELPBGB_03904 [Bacteroidia bacterium]|nr:hypothetical protein [Bacteroidia bacterium]